MDLLTKQPPKTSVLVVDVGNSHTVVGIFKRGKIVESWRLTTRHDTTSDEVFIRISGLMGSRSKVRPRSITHIGLCSVVPVLERTWVKALEYYLNKPVQVVGPTNCMNLNIGYANPSQLGADRIANAVAVLDRGIRDAIVLDLGTATTYEVIKNGRFEGGVIVPGISSGLDILTQKAARLMPVTLHWPNEMTADNTDDAIRSGLLYGFLGQMKYIIEGIKKEQNLPDNIPVIATGGWSSILREKSDLITEYDPFLTLVGIRLIALQQEK